MSTSQVSSDLSSSGCDKFALQQDDYGEKSYGIVEPSKLYGPDGWCEAAPSASDDRWDLPFFPNL